MAGAAGVERWMGPQEPHLSLELEPLLQGAPHSAFCTFHCCHGNTLILAWTWEVLLTPLSRLEGEGQGGQGSLEPEAHDYWSPQHYTKDKGAICTKLVKPKRKQGTKSAEEELAKGMLATKERSSHTQQPRLGLTYHPGLLPPTPALSWLSP